MTLGLARSHEGGCVPPQVSKRVLEVLSYLCRHHPKVAGALVELRVPTLDALAARLAARHDVKGAGGLACGVFVGGVRVRAMAGTQRRRGGVGWCGVGCELLGEL